MTTKASIGVVFATNLRELRRARGLTQIELARLSGLSLRYIGILERHEKSPTIDTIEAVAQALAVEPVQMVVPAGEEKWKIERSE
ncbi:helix-turn-helix domain-containing protein [Pseudaminobacter soli (ex Li et al. 2025)]|uniref:Transcriptional regulator n=1 Tax=Pseudaminobacter soli (ex Li et al. 2025) TaxID=1295366 RepID=A0A2P7RJE6_9HYPH|nr:helix-turn-helix transcriptional regulator [Mesorhizobium soli]PSJ50338.1 transcriptional regulator [Mesorhizobium soli]